MDIPNIPGAAIRHFQFIILGIWPVNLLTLAVQGHDWGWQSTPQAIMGLWEWGAFVAFSLALAAELGGKMFFALAERQRKIDNAREEGRQEGRKEVLQKVRSDERATTAAILDALTVAAQTNPDLIPALLEEYRSRYQNGTAADGPQ